MPRGFLFSLVSLSLLALALRHSYAAEVVETFDFDGKATIDCQCIPTGSFCGTRMQKAATDDARHSWSQTVYFRADKEVNFSRACWRKRDVDDLGSGLCCELHRDERDARWYGAETLNTSPKE